MNLSKLFGSIENSKKELKIQEYSISQTSLEQIFNQFAATQNEETGKVRGINRNSIDNQEANNSVIINSDLNDSNVDYKIIS